MAGFFHYFGRVFTEKGAWYKMIAMVALQVLMIVFAPKPVESQIMAGDFSSFNIPGILLYLLAMMLVSGFAIQVMSNAMRNGDKVLPTFDLGGMFVSTIRFIPFSLVWGIYIFLLAVGLAMLAVALKVVIAIVIALVAILAMFTAPVLWALHVKNFSYKYVLNPITPFRIFPRVVLPMFLLYLLIFGVSLVMYAIFFGGAFLIGFSVMDTSAISEMNNSTYIALAVLVCIFFYFNMSVQVAMNCRIADIVKSSLEDTEFLDDDYDIAVASDDDDYGDSDDSDDSLDY